MINRVILVGRITKDIVVKKTQSNLSVASFTVACNRRVSSQSEQTADFINCVAWRQSADFLARYAAKGSLVGIEGRIQTRSYDDQMGRKVYVTEVVCDSVQLLESKATNANRVNNNMNDFNNHDAFGQSGYEADNSFANDAFADFNSGPILDISSDDLPF